MTTVNVSESQNTILVTEESGKTTIVSAPSEAIVVKAIEVGPQGTKGDPGPPKSITVAPPKTGDEFTLFYTQYPTTLTQVIAIVRGTASSVEFELRYSPDRSSSGTLATVPENVTNSTTGELISIQNMPIPANNFLWIKVTSVTGNINELNVSVEI